ncbi:SDR family NAD(P)-dependent oxidoreductase [Blastopirellula marina]|uniref:Short-chain dehydrogenase/reductase SDR n=1 Tax=Blastopirellula marina DSM 3645 TaxID=314230 RepID=A3ZXG3_9BACT|nr:SDR family oxidoreductase [Blastopirellula marina]EAQ78753.1 Short-chain dehydrogenase/reductase SDR [Blastopirellula marina DSM 3645]
MTDAPTVLITGAAGGIGAATSLEFAARGYDCFLLDIDAAALADTVSAIENQGRSVATAIGDLGDLDFAQHAVRDCVEKFGRIDVLVNNAAWRDVTTMKSISRESWEKTIRVCLTAPAFLAQAAAPHMELRRQGVIINVSSIQSKFAAGVSPAYIAAKGGLDALTYELATLYGPSGVRVLAVNLGAIDTSLNDQYVAADGDSLSADLRQAVEQMIPLQRYGTPAEIARSIVSLAGPDSAYITGTCIEIDGGWFHQCSPYSFKRRQFPEDYPTHG